jgi:inhibitor of cysteine peptidase
MKITRIISQILLFMLILPVLFLSGCSVSEGGEVMVDETRDGSAVEVSVGENLVISLESNPSTGYTWQVLAVDTAILEKTGENEFVQAEGDAMLLGAGGREQMTFRAVAKGTTTLELGYKRPWEVEADPEQFFSIEVTVK